jgi:hypothetical protein
MEVASPCHHFDVARQDMEDTQITKLQSQNSVAKMEEARIECAHCLFIILQRTLNSLLTMRLTGIRRRSKKYCTDC